MQNHTMAATKETIPNGYPMLSGNCKVCFDTKKKVAHTHVMKSAGISVIQ